MFEILHTEKFLIFLYSAGKRKTILWPKCTVFLSVTLFIPALTFMLKFCLQRSKSCSSWVELKTFYQLFKLMMKEMCETSTRLENREAAWEKKDIKIQIKITLKQIAFWWALEEITSNGFICMRPIFSKFTALLWSVGRKLNSCLSSVKSELHSNIGYTLNCTERLENNNKDYTKVIVFKKYCYLYRRKENKYMRPKGVMSTETLQMRGQQGKLSRELKEGRIKAFSGRRWLILPSWSTM